MIENEEFVLVDSNVLIYAYDLDEREKNFLARKLLERVFNGKISIALSTQNLSEFYVNITKKINKPINIRDARRIIFQLISMPNVKILKIGESTILKAIDISSEFEISYWDALIAAVMKENDVENIITENERDFKKVKWLKVKNIFRGLA